MELGLATFADLAPGHHPAAADAQPPRGGRARRRARPRRVRDRRAPPPGLRRLVARRRLARRGRGRTERIRLSSAVTVLSSDDPVRVFQDFAQLDLISGGRAEIMAGRGSFIESFPLFGYDLDDYDDLFAEKLELLLALRDGTHVTWSGRHRAALEDAGVWPRPVQDPLPVWVAVGGTPAVGRPRGRARAAADDRDHRRRARALRAARRPLPRGPRSAPATTPETAKVAINTHAFVGETPEAGRPRVRHSYLAMMNRIGRERGWPPAGREQYDGAALAARRARRRLARAGRREDPLRARALRPRPLHRADERRARSSTTTSCARSSCFGTEVAPVVRAEVARRETTPAAAV